MLGLLCLKTRTGQGALCVRYSETLPRPRKDVMALTRGVTGVERVSDRVSMRRQQQHLSEGAVGEIQGCGAQTGSHLFQGPRSRFPTMSMLLWLLFT